MQGRVTVVTPIGGPFGRQIAHTGHAQSERGRSKPLLRMAGADLFKIGCMQHARLDALLCVAQ